MTKLEKQIEELILKTVGGGTHKDWFIELEDGIMSLVKAERERVVKNIKQWTKGKAVTKDKLREYLNDMKHEHRYDFHTGFCKCGKTLSEEVEKLRHKEENTNYEIEQDRKLEVEWIVTQVGNWLFVDKKIYMSSRCYIKIQNALIKEIKDHE